MVLNATPPDVTPSARDNGITTTKAQSSSVVLVLGEGLILMQQNQTTQQEVKGTLSQCKQAWKETGNIDNMKCCQYTHKKIVTLSTFLVERNTLTLSKKTLT